MIPGITTKISESTLASSTSIAPLTDLVFVSGTTAIATIVPPPNYGTGFSAGILILVATDAAGVSTVTTGNIALAVAMTTGKSCVFVYSARYTKWYPGTIS